MKLSELINALMIRNGQYVLGDMAKLKLDLPKCWELVRPVLAKYQSYVPLTKKFNINCGSQNFFEFTNDSHNVGWVEGESKGTAPTRITSVVPISGGISANPFMANAAYGTAFGTENQDYYSRLINPRPFLFEYREVEDRDGDGNKVLRYFLYLSETGLFDVTANYTYEVRKTLNGSVLTEAEIVDIEKDDLYTIFEDLASARFLIAVGNARDAFTYTDMPITTNAKDLISAGTRQWDAALEELHDRHSFWEAIRP